ncbi:MAG: EAL domain-containing protein [Pseudomonadota bacterium]
MEGAEALLRWRSPEDGLVSPGAFLPLLEAVGLIVPVGDWVVEQAARDCQEWMRAGLPPVTRGGETSRRRSCRHSDFEGRFMQAVESWSKPQLGPGHRDHRRRVAR